MRPQRLATTAASLAVLAAALLVPAQAGTPAKVDFKKDVMPILKKNCIGCHNADDASGDLALDSVKGIQKGGESGKLFKAGHADDSLIVKRLLGKGGIRMPKGRDPLKDKEIQTIKTWINKGAKM